jgi:hypothetical protein
MRYAGRKANAIRSFFPVNAVSVRGTIDTFDIKPSGGRA